MSVHNHYSGFTDEARGWLDSPLGIFDEHFAHAPADIRVFLMSGRWKDVFTE